MAALAAVLIAAGAWLIHRVATPRWPLYRGLASRSRYRSRKPTRREQQLILVRDSGRVAIDAYIAFAWIGVISHNRMPCADRNEWRHPLERHRHREEARGADSDCMCNCLAQEHTKRLHVAHGGSQRGSFTAFSPRSLICHPYQRGRRPKGRGLHDREHAQAGALTSSSRRNATRSPGLEVASRGFSQRRVGTRAKWERFDPSVWTSVRADELAHCVT